MGAGHVGFSVVATDVGGGFSIGLGGLGYAMGLSGSWLLFTGLLGAWLAAVFLIPRVKPLADAVPRRSRFSSLFERPGDVSQTAVESRCTALFRTWPAASGAELWPGGDVP